MPQPLSACLGVVLLEPPTAEVPPEGAGPPEGMGPPDGGGPVAR